MSEAVSLPEQRARQVRERILDGAIAVFAERGFGGTTIKEVAQAADCKHSLVMYHFGSKQALWEQAAEWLMERFDARHAQYLEAMLPARNDRERVNHLLQAFIWTLREMPAYGRLLLQEGSTHTDRTLWLHHHYVPSRYRNIEFDDPDLTRELTQVTLLRSVVAGAILYVVLAAPQIAVSAAEDGGEDPAAFEPLTDKTVERLADMLTDFVCDQRAEVSPREGFQ